MVAMIMIIVVICHFYQSVFSPVSYPYFLHFWQYTLLQKSYDTIKVKKTKDRNVCKIFSLVPSKKPVTRENCNKLSVSFSIFEWWNWLKYQLCQIAKCQMAFFGIIVNSIIKNWKVMKGMTENILHVIRICKSQGIFPKSVWIHEFQC